MADERPSRAIIDPSVPFGDDDIGWLRDEETRRYLAISSALADRLYRPVGGALPGFDEQLPRIREALDGLATFSWRQVEDLPRDPAAIRDALLDSDDPLREVWADEWVFLVSQSWGVFGKVRRGLEAIAHAGAHVVEVTNAEMESALGAVRGIIPPRVLDALKFGANFPRPRVPHLLVAGGVIALGLVPQLAVPLAVVGLVQTGTAIIVGDP